MHFRRNVEMGSSCTAGLRRACGCDPCDGFAVVEAAAVEVAAVFVWVVVGDDDSDSRSDMCVARVDCCPRGLLCGLPSKPSSSQMLLPGMSFGAHQTNSHNSVEPRNGCEKVGVHPLSTNGSYFEYCNTVVMSIQYSIWHTYLVPLVHVY